MDMSSCVLLRSCSRLLRLPARAIATALSYYHHYRRSPIFADPGDKGWILVAACIFLASKTEEVSLSNNHLLNVVRIVSLLPLAGPSGLGQSDPSTGNFTLHQTISNAIGSSSVLVGQQYYDAKSDLLVMEQVLLRSMRFKLAIVESQPYTYLFSTLKTVSASPALVEASISVMNDVVSFTTIPLDVQPLQVAVACIHVSSILVDLPVSANQSTPELIPTLLPHGCSHPPSWYEAVGVAKSDVELIGNKILDGLAMALSSLNACS